MLIIGIDPDSDRHGVAVYKNGKLEILRMMSRNEIIEEFKYNAECFFSIENVASSNALHTKKGTRNPRVNQSIARRIGLNQQSQIELMRDLDYYGMPYVLHKPSSRWKNQAEMELFKRATGWDKRSNADTRSAAYFGFLESNKRFKNESKK